MLAGVNGIVASLTSENDKHFLTGSIKARLLGQRSPLICFSLSRTQTLVELQLQELLEALGPDWWFPPEHSQSHQYELLC